MDKKLISLPKEQIDYINKRRAKFGTSFSEYIRTMIQIEMMQEDSVQMIKKIDSGKNPDQAYKEVYGGNRCERCGGNYFGKHTC